jgi:arylsulfatase A-like enzyme/Flp pilus assembly protein TadD
MRMRRKIVGLAAAVGLAVGLGVWQWVRPSHGPHLLIITLDTTRADRLGCYGYEQAQTPVLDSLAAEGILFEEAYTVAPITLPTHTSLFTGLYPAETGIRTNGRGRLPESITTLASVLKQRGYETAAFIASVVLNRKYGLNQGFETYDDELGEDQSTLDPMHRQRSGETVVDSALRWLDRTHRRPFCCWVHLFDPHSPYVPHTDLFGDEFADRPYDGEIAYVDRQVGRLIDFLKVRGLEQDTLVVVLGDHGEGLGDHGERMHSYMLYKTTMHVPLIFRRPGRLPAGKRVAPRVSLVDASPTILECLEIADPRQTTARSFYQALRGETLPASGCFGSTDQAFLVSGCSPLRSLTEGNWKYIRTTRPELYHLTDDPHEMRNLAAENPDKARELDARLEEFESRLVLRERGDVQLTASERRALSSLGYLGGSAAPREGPAPDHLPDIKDMLPLYDAIDDAEDLVTQGEVTVGIERLRELIPQAPRHTQAYLSLANALCMKSKFGEAEKVLRELLKAVPECSEGNSELATVLYTQGQFEEAIPEFEKTIELDPLDLDAYRFLSLALVKTGRPGEGLAELDRALRVNPGSIHVYLWRAELQADQGHLAEAIADCRSALKLVPESAIAHQQLGDLLAETGATREARQHLVRAVELEPRQADFQYALGAFLVRQKEYPEAIKHLTEAVQLQPGHPAAIRQIQEAQQALRGAQ